MIAFSMCIRLAHYLCGSGRFLLFSRRLLLLVWDGSLDGLLRRLSGWRLLIGLRSRLWLGCLLVVRFRFLLVAATPKLSDLLVN